MALVSQLSMINGFLLLKLLLPVLAGVPVLCLAQASEEETVMIYEQDINNIVLSVSARIVSVEPYISQFIKDFPDAPRPQQAREYMFSVKRDPEHPPTQIHSFVDLEYANDATPTGDRGLQVLAAAMHGHDIVVIFKHDQLTHGLVIVDDRRVIPTSPAGVADILARDSETDGPVASATIVRLVQADLKVELQRASQRSPVHVALRKVDDQYVWQKKK